jgi:putative PIN family toxin of toxin-antitoxin system
MIPPAARVVFDCNVLLQALASPDGPSGLCLGAVVSGRLTLVVSQGIVDEFASVAARPRVAAKLGISPAMVERAIATIGQTALMISEAPEVFAVDEDPDDSIYVNVALSAGAIIIASRDNHLLRLMDQTTQGGAVFTSRFPHLKVLTPVALLLELRA